MYFFVGRFTDFLSFPCLASSSFFHRARTVQVAMQDLVNARGSLATRERALRLVARVAKLVDTLSHLPSNQEIIDFCTECTTRQCKGGRLINHHRSSVSWWISLPTLADDRSKWAV